MKIDIKMYSISYIFSYFAGFH